MNSLSQEQLLIVIRALSTYLLEQVQNDDTTNAEKTAKLLHEATHNLKG
jgi:hypothetical protein